MSRNPTSHHVSLLLSTSSMFYLLLLTLLIHFSQSALIEPITSTPLRPFSINENYTTDYSLAFHIPTAISSKAAIQVEFPQIYLIPSTCLSMLQTPDQPYQKYKCEKTSPSQYLVTLDKIVEGDYYLVFENIMNPSTYSASSNFKIRTYYNQDILVDANEYFDAVPFLSTPRKSCLNSCIVTL